MRVVNLTRSDVTVVHPDKPSVTSTYPRSETGYASVQIENVTIGDVNGFPVTEQKFGGIINLPSQDDGKTVYIVNRQVRAALPDRDDLICPGRAIRKGNTVVGCFGFSR